MSPARLDKVEAAPRAAAGIAAAVSARDPSALAAWLAPDCLLETCAPAPDGTVVAGAPAIAAWAEAEFARRPGLAFAVEELTGFGLRCALRFRASWRDGGTGGTAARRGVLLLAVAGDKAARLQLYLKSNGE